MPTNVVMPQMGESITEGTIVRWIKKVGDVVDHDEPMFEISTDKVDAEIPSPAAGVLTEIRHREGETVAVNTVVAVVSQATETPIVRPPVDSVHEMPGVPRDAAAPREPAKVASQPAAQSRSGQGNGVAGRRSSPLVRRIAKEHDVNIDLVRGTGLAGRVTRDDILAFIAGTPAPGAIPASRPASVVSAHGRVEKMSVMRRKIAEHMVASRRTAAHVHTVFEVDFARVAKIRDAKKAEYERQGVKLTFLSFILKAVTTALRAVPVINASVDGENVIYHDDVNLGVAVALDWGLIVPVIRKADEKSLSELSRAVADVASRARAKQLKPEEVMGGTFTITNPGGLGALFGMPIINQPQVAILAVGNIEKRPVVVDDHIVVGTRAYFTLGFDHRLIDGLVADQFLAHVKHTLENWDPATL